MKAEIFLDGKWFFKSFPADNKLNFSKIDWDRTKSWDKGSVPGSVQGDLLKLGKVPDPFFERGAEKYRFIEQKEWWYQKEFSLPEALNNKRIYIRFEGLDTITVIYLNGREVGKTQNMFTPYEFEITDMVNKGKNKIAIGFASPILTAEQRDKRGIAQSLAHNTWYAAYHIRKANFAYGGDMSQRMVTTGIWKPVKITGYDKARIIDCQITSKTKDKKATISLNVEIEKLADKDIPINLQVRLKGRKILKDTSFVLREDRKTVKASFQIDNPNLWWPNGMGKQNLYSIEVELRHKDKVLDAREDRFGVREVQLLQEMDKVEGGKTFTFAINGVKVFAKGANWVPADNLMYPVPKERYRKLIKLAKEANFNMFRINGFGIYEDEEFYKACDEAGIMLWQDFMFSDCPYPDDDKEFLKECKREGEVAVKRLRNHPCVVLWCGNNEVDECYYTSGYKGKAWHPWGEKIFHEILPEICRRLDPARPYWPSSAWTAPGKYPLSKDAGDFHYYPWNNSVFRPLEEKPYGKVEHNRFSFENISYLKYAEEKAKFYSEFGQRGLPDITTLRKIMKKESIWPFNYDEWLYHSTRCHWGEESFDKINLLIREFRGPELIKDIKEYVFYSQLVQAKALKFAIEHFRVREFSCSGALFWQYNDCWPTNTYSIIDYYLNKKMAYYWVKKAFSPLLITFIKRDECIEVWIVNDLLSEVKGKFALSKMDFTGKVSLNEKKEIKILPNSSLKVKEIKLSGLKVNKESEFLLARLEVKGKTKAENKYFFSLQRDLLFPKCNLRKRIEKIAGGKYKLSISSDTYARLVKIETGRIECDLTDNFFDIAPGEKKEIIAKPVNLKQEKKFPVALKIKALNRY